ncbi:thiamine-phosphate kinase [Kocuria massiliensis]|uniref:thiamine-phosphate kinase n=1 Tax=Kocuria massiliensis TaxID=1926282 RepID=UPI0022B962DF|nr:thiamine-phosphate kinase [Kocuria massiliensis]
MTDSVAAEAPTVADTTEEELLRPIIAIFDEHNRWVAERNPDGELILGPGDDCAVYDLSSGRTVVTIDSQTQGQDYLLEWPCGYQTSGFDMGWKSAAQNLADVAAMGAIPTGLVVSLVLPPTTALTMTEDIARGYCAALRALGASRCTIGGGDVGSGTELGATVAAFGLVPLPREGARTTTADAAVRRSGARAGDLVVIAGTVGRAAAGLDVLRSGGHTRPVAATSDPVAWAHPRGGAEALAASQLRPLPPIAMGPVLAEHGATAMIDVSDGLLKDAERLARASGVSIDLDGGLLEPLLEPLRDEAARLGRDPWEWLLAGGEDHGLLATLPASMPVPEGARAIGFCGELSDRESLVVVDGRARRHRGWDHFAAEDRV